MKARVKATGEIVDIDYIYKTAGNNPISRCGTLEGKRYNEDDLDFIIEDNNTPDYWTRLEHTYAGMAMQGMLNNSLLITSLLKVNKSHEDIVAEVTDTAIRYAHALVQKLKQKEEKK